MLVFFAIIVLSGVLLWGCSSGPAVVSHANYLSSPPVIVDLEKIQVVEQESLMCSSATVLDINIVDLVRQWTKSAFVCSGSGIPLNVEIVEAKLAPLRELQSAISSEEENTYVGILDVRIFIGKNPLSSRTSHSIHSKVSVTIPSHYTLKERRHAVLSLAEEVVEILHKEVVRYIDTQGKLRR
ncbi:hypothetical protein [Holospora curviuscula]|uniref:Uncharacterized protein n=1 Tax=Holospora curviuscula TaxID=1082868 RepID=A0A2S5R8D4_9PROT|nr:hypothetical protein [Holospora curviuscula]PPE03442.1 hypothetical protein HCUR_01111 [Holospora curviuscula]